ncbi:MAG: cytochrome c biogenesis protein CcsA [Planctomycetota bacterium]
MMRRLVAIVVVLWCASLAGAQAGPAGNQHPEADLVGSPAYNAPFGAPHRPAATPEQKLAFAAGVDLAPLRGVPVFHAGRVKILDTLARETVRAVTGRARYEELVVAQGVAIDAEGPDWEWRYARPRPDALDKAKLDPLFTLLDLAIDPGHYVDRPLVGVEYLTLRDRYLQAAFPDNEEKQELWRLMTRVSPRAIETHSSAIFERYGDEPQMRQSIGRVERALGLAAGTAGNMVLVAPESLDLPWRHVEDLPASHPARGAAERLGAAWRSLDAAATNRAIDELVRELAAIHPETQPVERARLELLYNRGRFFDWGMWAYLAGFLGLILAFGTGRRWLIITGVAMLAVAVALHATGFTLRCIIAERFAIQNQFESMTGLSLFAALAGLGMTIWKRQWLFGAAAAGVGFLVLIAATQTGIPGESISREAAILNTSVLLKYHVTTVLVSYGLISLGFLCAVFYLVVSLVARLRGAKTSDDLGSAGTAAMVALHGDEGAQPRTLARTLADLDSAHMTVLQLAFWTLGVGILLGAWWADHSWGRWWAFDPKETWALITWIIYLIVIHLRLVMGRNKALMTAWLSIVGFLMMLWCYFGVNLLLPGLHAYA